jgi:hypothetical protein
MKRLGSCLILFLCFSSVIFAQSQRSGPRIYEQSGNFSFCPPLGWNVTEFPGLKYKIASGPAEGNFAANINFVDEEYNGSLRSYVDLSLSQVSSFFQEYKLLDRSEFKTNSGITGERVVINNRQHGFFLRQIFYFLPAAKNKYFVVTCSALDNVSAKYLSVFDESIQTFEINK